MQLCTKCELYYARYIPLLLGIKADYQQHNSAKLSRPIFYRLNLIFSLLGYYNNYIFTYIIWIAVSSVLHTLYTGKGLLIKSSLILKYRVSDNEMLFLRWLLWQYRQYTNRPTAVMIFYVAESTYFDIYALPLQKSSRK